MLWSPNRAFLSSPCSLCSLTPLATLLQLDATCPDIGSTEFGMSSTQFFSYPPLPGDFLTGGVITAGAGAAVSSCAASSASSGAAAGAGSSSGGASAAASAPGSAYGSSAAGPSVGSGAEVVLPIPVPTGVSGGMDVVGSSVDMLAAGASFSDMLVDAVSLEMHSTSIR